MPDPTCLAPRLHRRQANEFSTIPPRLLGVAAAEIAAKAAKSGFGEEFGQAQGLHLPPPNRLQISSDEAGHELWVLLVRSIGGWDVDGQHEVLQWNKRHSKPSLHPLICRR